MVSIFVSKILVLPNKKFACEFNDGLRYCLFDMSPYLSQRAFIPLNDSIIFGTLSCDNGIPNWDGGRIDIAPEYIFDNGQKISAEEYSRISYMTSEFDPKSLARYLNQLK